MEFQNKFITLQLSFVCGTQHEVIAANIHSSIHSLSGYGVSFKLQPALVHKVGTLDGWYTFPL
jgi:hypothetical protein